MKRCILIRVFDPNWVTGAVKQLVSDGVGFVWNPKTNCLYLFSLPSHYDWDRLGGDYPLDYEVVDAEFNISVTTHTNGITNQVL